MQDDEILIGAFAKNKKEEIRAVLSKFRGFDLLSLRVWFKADDGEFRPSKSGFSIQAQLIPSLLAVVEQAQQVAAKNGLLLRTDMLRTTNVEPSADQIDDLLNLLDDPKKRT